MILNDVSLIEWAKTNVSPFNPDNINPASLDLTVGDTYIDLATNEEKIARIYEGILILPGDAILATTQEFVNMPSDCAGVIYLKSSLARQGLDHALAGWVEPDFCGQLTLEFHAHRPIILNVGQRVCQIVLNRMEAAPFRSYKTTGRYNGQIGPTRAR